jgi:uncharacterized protein YecE (DUF72 family)
MIRTGTCSWTEKTLIQSGLFYPPDARTAEARLRYYATHFDTVEVDSTYYAIPDQKTAWLWDMRTPADFTFHIKAYGALTGHGVDPRTLPRDVQSLVSRRPGESKYTYVKEPSLLKMLAQRLIDALSPLAKSGKLGLVIFQFPPWFTHKSSNLEYILFCREMMNDMPIAAEFRHGSWFSSGSAQRTFDFLGEHDITYVTADEPQYGNLSTAPFVPHVTTDTAYFRFHGRNTENWLKKGVETALRYAYAYSEDELAAFANHLSEADKKATTTYAMFNNCYRDYAVANAVKLRRFLQNF